VDIVIAGPGRAGLSLAHRLLRSDHRVAGILGRDPHATTAAAAALGCPALGWDRPLPPCDLLVVAVRDDAIAGVADHLAPRAAATRAAVHLSGLVPVAALDPLGIPAGSFHPLQTMPDPETGARLLDGAWVAITSGDRGLADALDSLARSLGMHPFEIADAAKPTYHAAAAAAANFPLAALAMAEDLFAASGVPFEAAGPLVRAVVANAFTLGPRAALTGPIARGDAGTVAAQVAAASACDPGLGEAFLAMARATARVAGTGAGLDEVLG
jgi:predicted short-subunit dehydrogenase-like oxidoreductase (DUF2520 family)